MLAALLASACSGGGGDEPGNLGGSAMRLEELSVSSGQLWQINRPIEFRFSKPVDVNSVSMNTLNISEVTGGPAVGEFRIDPTRPNVVTFQPRCPLEPDFSDAGLLPGGRQYRISVPTTANGATTVISTEGTALGVGATLVFSTPSSTLPIDLFIDGGVGPARAITGSVDENGAVSGTRIRLTDDDGDVFQIPFVLVDGIGKLPAPGVSNGGAFAEFVVPLNLYSDAATRFEVVVELDQAVSPAAANIDQSRVQLQFQNGGAWSTFSTQVELAANCTTTGSTLVLRPLGVLPQDRPMRVVITPEFEDIVGDREILAQDSFATMQTGAFVDGAGNPVDFADELLEEFLVGGAAPGSFEDTESVFSTPRADWGGGSLDASFDFEGTGGPGGDFDWHIPPNSEFVLDTSSSVITGGPNGVPTGFQVVIGGSVDVRDLFVPATSTLRIQGPNAAFIQCSGTCRVEGVIRVNGGNASSVFGLATPTQPEVGAAGNAGGGDGGTGSFLTSTVTTRGGNGNGAFNVTGTGGQGGESGWHPSAAVPEWRRRAGGGGGGTFGPDVVLPNGCVDQGLIGLDVESGFPGTQEANSAIRLGEVLPWGGLPAERPFTDENGADDDFLGVKRKDFGTPQETLVAGELPGVWGGSGGGAGGDATRATTYPPPTLVPTHTDKGAGGGGGAGGLTIYALGDIVVGPVGRIEARGGHGGGGGSTNFVNRVGGGSGGGAGGHIILQTASKLDLSAVPTTSTAILARGGQGGEGHTGATYPTTGSGGASDTGETTPQLDAKHVGTTGPGDLGDNGFLPPVPAMCQVGTAVVRAAGGDGGPGVVQIHVGSLPGDILYPQGGAEAALASAVRPPPVGYELAQARWVDQLLPAFGRFSSAQTDWIALGGAAFGPGSEVPGPIRFLFEGTDPATGEVLRLGDQVAELDPLLAPAAPIEAPGLPEIDAADPRVLRLDASPLVGDDELYVRNPNLLRRFRVRVGALELDVQSASYDEDADALALRVSSQGPELPTQGNVELVPRFFVVTTGGSEDFLPESAGIKIEFQATSANALGQPDTAAIVPGEASPETGGWASDVSALNTPGSAAYRFYRLRVTFDIQADGGSLTSTTPRPKLDFLRLPFDF